MMDIHANSLQDTCTTAFDCFNPCALTLCLVVALQPLLHYQYVGQYKAAEPAPMRAEGLRDGHPLSAR